MKEAAEVVEVKETTPEAFGTMITFIYNPLGGDRFGKNNIGCPPLAKHIQPDFRSEADRLSGV